MIIRVLQATIAPRRSADFHTFVIEQCVSVWRDWDAIAAALGPDPLQPFLLTPETGLVSSVQVLHFEAVDPLPGAERLVGVGERPSVS